MFWRFHFFGKTPFCGRVCMFWKLIFFEGSIWGANWNVLRAPFLRRIGVGFSWEVCEYYFHPCLKTYVHDMAKLNPFMQDSFTDCAFSLVSYIYIYNQSLFWFQRFWQRERWQRRVCSATAWSLKRSMKLCTRASPEACTISETGTSVLVTRSLACWRVAVRRNKSSRWVFWRTDWRTLLLKFGWYIWVWHKHLCAVSHQHVNIQHMLS